MVKSLVKQIGFEERGLGRNDQTFRAYGVESTVAISGVKEYCHGSYSIGWNNQGYGLKYYPYITKCLNNNSLIY